jgi:uncharacterized protein YjbJ (UPF0337 family)
MNNKQLENKVRQDATKLKKDLGALVEDSSTRITRIGDNVYQVTGKAKDDLTTWVDDSVSQLSGGIEKLAGDARESVVDAATSVKKDVSHGLKKYNAKVQEVADRVPGDFSKKAARYPWVALSIALAIGFVLGGLLKPARHIG